MKTATFQTLALTIGSAFAVAILVCLVLVIQEFRINTEARRVQTYQEVLTGAAAGDLDTAITDSGLFPVFIAASDGQAVNPEEQVRLNMWMLSRFTTFYQVHHLYERGWLSDEIREAWEYRTIDTFRSLFYTRGWWRNNKQRFPQSYRDYVESFLPERYL